MLESVTPATPVLKPATRKGFAASPIDTATAPHRPATRDETCWSIKTRILRETSLHFTLRSFKIEVFLQVFLRTDLKIDVLCEASVDFHHMWQYATTPATEFLHLVTTSHMTICDSHKARLTTRLKCCACHAKWHWRSPKCFAGHEKCSASSENVAKRLRVPHRTTFDTSWNMCSATPATRNEAKRRWKAPKGTAFAELTVGTAIRPSRGRLRTAANGCATFGEQLHIPRIELEPLLRTREKKHVFF